MSTFNLSISNGSVSLPLRGGLGRASISLSESRAIAGKNEYRCFCPACRNQRKPAHRNERPLWLSLDTGCYHCHNCGLDGRLDSDEWLMKSSDRSDKSDSSDKSDKSDKSETMMSYLSGERQLSREALAGAGVIETRHFMPQTGREEDCVAFQYKRDSVVVGRKYRTRDKHFTQDRGRQQIPYLLDTCRGKQEVIITEGEIDALSYLTAGFESVVSMPDGAMARTDWLNPFWDSHFADKTTVYIATDSDAPGEKAAEELIRRFGAEVCRRVRYGEGCKDANDVLCRHGSEALVATIKEARPVPVEGLVGLTDFRDQLDALYQNGPDPGKHTGWENLDRIVSFGLGQLALVTGRSNDGKSEWLDELIVRLLTHSDWTAAYWTPENTLLDHSRKLIEKVSGQSLTHTDSRGLQRAEFERTKQWLDSHVAWIDLPFDKLHLENILDHARMLVRKRAVQLLVMDPYNFILKETSQQLTENAWDSQAIGRIRQFAIENNVLVFLVAHPRKVEMQIDGRRRRITMEDIAGTADFGNKADYCFSVERDDERHLVTVYIDKVRRKQYGIKGRHAYFTYVRENGRYLPTEVEEHSKSVERIDRRDENKSWVESSSDKSDLSDSSDWSDKSEKVISL